MWFIKFLIHRLLSLLLALLTILWYAILIIVRIVLLPLLMLLNARLSREEFTKRMDAFAGIEK